MNYSYTACPHQLLVLFISLHDKGHREGTTRGKQSRRLLADPRGGLAESGLPGPLAFLHTALVTLPWSLKRAETDVVALRMLAELRWPVPEMHSPPLLPPSLLGEVGV